jgi:hypothetical protein
MGEDRAREAIEDMLRQRKLPVRCQSYDSLLALARRTFGLGPGADTFIQIYKIVMQGAKEPPPRLCK